MNEINKKESSKGEMNYDFNNDILYFKVKNREYDRSLEFENMVIDVDSDGSIIGIQIFDASEFLRMEKTKLSEVNKWSFQAIINEESIEIRINFNISINNKLFEKNPIIIQRNNEKLPNSDINITV